jgi:hypothetical protein
LDVYGKGELAHFDSGCSILTRVVSTAAFLLSCTLVVILGLWVWIWHMTQTQVVRSRFAGIIAAVVELGAGEES